MFPKKLKMVPKEEFTGIEQWPAHALGRCFASSSVCVSNGHLRVLSEVDSKIPNLVPKPKFVQYLEKKIGTSLCCVKEHDVDGRLQIFREIFQNIIYVFKTYEPVLTQIYREYEAALEHYKNEARKLRPVQEYLWTISQECDQRILAMQNKDKPEYEGLKREIVKLNAIISSQKEEQIMLKTQIDKLMESLEEEHARCRHESDAKHLMITEINSLRIQCAELEAITRQTQVMSSQTDDPVLLRIALEQAKKAQSEANFEIAKLKADYVDVVPKKEYEQLLAAKQQQEQEHEKQVAQFNEFMQNLAQCEEQLGTVVAQRDEYYRKLQQLTRASTPRPDWNEVGRRLPCGLTKWDEDTHDMTSQQKVFHLLKELTAESEGSEEQEAKASGGVRGGAQDLIYSDLELPSYEGSKEETFPSSSVSKGTLSTMIVTDDQ